MKSANMLFVAAMVMVVMPVKALIMGGAKQGTTDVTHCLRSKIDGNGQTFLHKIANNCDNDGFAVSIKLFDFIENELPALDEEDNELRKELILLNTAAQISPDLAMILMLSKAKDFVEIKDNNGETALDIAKRRNEYSAHNRCATCVELLSIFDATNKDAQ